MHPILSAAVAEDLRQRRLAEAGHHRLVRVARAGKPDVTPARVAAARRLVAIAERIDPRLDPRLDPRVDACLDDGVAGRVARA